MIPSFKGGIYAIFFRYGLLNPVYINVIRDPIERAISHFYYKLYGGENDDHPRPTRKPVGIHQPHKSHNAFVPYLTIHHSEQKCAHFCSECLSHNPQCTIHWKLYCEIWDRCIVGCALTGIPSVTRAASETRWFGSKTGGCMPVDRGSHSEYDLKIGTQIFMWYTL